MTLLDKEPVKRVEKILREFDGAKKIIILDTSARTAIEAASSLGCEVGAIIKSLLFKIEHKFILCLVAGDKKASLNKIKKILNIKDVSMASANDVKNITGFTIGGVSPIGHLTKLKIFLDNNLKRFTKIYAAAGHPNAVFGIDFNQFLLLTSAEIKEFTE